MKIKIPAVFKVEEAAIIVALFFAFLLFASIPFVLAKKITSPDRIQYTFTIKGTIFVDTNKNGKMDHEEQAYWYPQKGYGYTPAIVITRLPTNSLWAMGGTQNPRTPGEYVFSRGITIFKNQPTPADWLVSGIYSVKLNVPPGYVSTSKNPVNFTINKAGTYSANFGIRLSSMQKSKL